MFAVTILGNNSALPAYGRFPTAQVVTLNEQAFLIDCGEGTQIQMSKYKVRRSKINHIFISHLHGDHYFGLVGLITSMGLLGRENDLHLYAPAPLKQILDIQFTVADTRLPFTLHFHALENEGLVVDDKKFMVECFKTQHRIECWGFIIREKKQPRKINKEKIKEYTIPTTYYERLKNGDDYQTKDGDIIKNEILTIANTLAKSYAFCADTIYDESLVDKVTNVSLLYHETTYLKDLEDRATDRFHSTTVQAASIAKKANVNKLLIGHFSSKYEQLDIFEQEAKEVFANTQLAIDGVTFLIK
ncbi:MAG: ribonuclease Z [Bacteroidetes bacterium]|nr:ribonuclease Z [Bacteroidota bacterium]MBS1642818.1 ribonuclease Z [Bacteroidota bacterium]MBS1670309.1 ribonuclease Z [Bacteroidota bacterium]